MSIWNDVERFGRACGVRLRGVPGWVPDDELDLALNLTAEELGELDFALDGQDLVEAADAVCDSLYVLAGLALRLGIARRHMPDLMKPDSDAPIIGFTALTREDIQQVREDLEIGHARILNAENTRNLIEMDASIHELMFGVAGVGYMLGLPLQAVWEEVQRSNMGKRVGGIVIRRVDGKICKPADWTPPDIAGVLGAHGWSEAA